MIHTIYIHIFEGERMIDITVVGVTSEEEKEEYPFYAANGFDRNRTFTALIRQAR